MSGGIHVEELPSWMLVLLIGLGVAWATSEGLLAPGYAVLGRLLVFSALCLGAFYFAHDISEKL